MSTIPTALTLLAGDAVALYASLSFALLLRYGSALRDEFMHHHLLPFSIIFAVWIIVFYIAGLYDIRQLRNGLGFIKTLWLTFILNVLIAIALFYLIPFFGIAPKTNLFIFIAMFAVIETLWRRAFNALIAGSITPCRVLLVGGGNAAEEINRLVKENLQLGYRIAAWVRPSVKELESPTYLKELAAEHTATTIIIERRLKNRPAFSKTLYHLLSKGIEIRDLPNFYELLLRKVPLGELEESWFLEHVAGQQRFYDPLKHGIEFLGAFVIGIVLLPIELAIAAIIALTSRGPILIRQKRVGALGKLFTLYKFRSMVALSPDGQAETKGAQWSAPNDARTTTFGKFLRHTHLDELPQLWNIICGDLSFVGPRPERPEFVERLKGEIPYYEIRLLVKPGVTGWAQINHRKDLTNEDVAQKLQYDIYYVKNRSLLFDLAIVVRTIKTLFVTPE